MEGADFLKLEELILLAIAGKPEIYGLEISGDIERASEGAVQINYGSLYPYLNRLEKKGYITSRWEEENDRKGARRKYYQITDTGLASLDSAALIRQRLRQTTIEIVTQPESNLDNFIKNLEHPEQEIRIQVISQLQTLARVEPQHHWTIIKALAAFIRAKSPASNFSQIREDIKAALNVIRQLNRPIDRSIEQLDLSMTGLKGANLSGVNLIRANLSGANLSGADLRFTNIREADLIRADLSEAKLSEADLSEANLSEANLSEANLRKANLIGANLRLANLRLANLGEANLSGANLSEANLSVAKLRLADLRKANLAYVGNLTIVQLHSAKNWEQAIDLPDYLKGK